MIFVEMHDQLSMIFEANVATKGGGGRYPILDIVVYMAMAY
jgi:hypothetical protein